MRNFQNFRFCAPWIGLALALLIAPAAGAGVTILDDGAAGGTARILVQSAIRRGELAQLEAAFDQVATTAKGRINGVEFVTVELDSPGGDVVEALGMGRAIDRHLAMTLVRPGRECVSACVFVLMAGAVHTPIDGAEIGVHRPMLVSWTHMDAREAHARYDGLMAYLREYFRVLGISDDAYRTMMGTDPFGMHDFTGGELDAFRLRGEGPAWRHYFSEKQDFENAPQVTALTGQPIQSRTDRLAPVPEAYRTVIFMPGDFHTRADYFAGTDIEPAHFIWDSLDSSDARPDWSSPDIEALLTVLALSVKDTFQPIWWLVLALVLELARGLFLPWPGLDRDSRWIDRWRLKPFG